MAFRFALESLLAVRQSQERQEELRLLALAQQIAQVERELQHLAQQELMMWEQTRQWLREGLAGAEINFEATCALARAERRQVLERARATLEQQRLAQQRAYQRARQAREVLQSLRDRQWESYRILQKRREQRELDELFLRRRGAGEGSRGDENGMAKRPGPGSRNVPTSPAK